MNSKSPFVTPFGRENEANAIKRAFKVEDSDFLTIEKVYNLWKTAAKDGSHFKFCRKNFLSHQVRAVSRCRLAPRLTRAAQNLTQIEELRAQFFGFLVDAGFVDRATAPKGRARFFTVPEACDVNSGDHKLVMSCIAAAMYPKLLVLDASRQWRTLANSAPAAIHPSSVNFNPGRRPDFGDARYVAFFNIMQSKKLCASFCFLAGKPGDIDDEVRHRRLGVWQRRRAGGAVALRRCRLQASFALVVHRPQDPAPHGPKVGRRAQAPPPPLCPGPRFSVAYPILGLTKGADLQSEDEEPF